MTLYYAVLDADDRPVAFYSDDLFPPLADGAMNAAIPPGAVEISADVHRDCIANVGWRKIVDGVAAPVAMPPAAAAPVVVPPSISRRQLATQAAIQGDITQDEALAWQRGTLPALLSGTIARLPQAQQFPATMAMFTDRFDRDSPWTASVAAMMGKSDMEIDAMWTAAAALP